MSNVVRTSTGRIDYYSVLGILPTGSAGEPELSAEILKSAYRRTLLQHHPDKAFTQRASGIRSDIKPPGVRYTIDEIVQAYQVLADPAAKSAYDKTLLEQRRKGRLSANNTAKAFGRSGFEALDLEDLDYEESSSTWSRKCRCGSAYRVDEQQLEGAADDGELIVGCQGCSLCIKVIFQAVEEEDES